MPKRFVEDSEQSYVRRPVKRPVRYLSRAHGTNIHVTNRAEAATAGTTTRPLLNTTLLLLPDHVKRESGG